MEKFEFDEMIKAYLKENLTIDVSTKSATGDFGYCDYRSYKAHVVTIMLGDEEISRSEFDTGGD